MTRRRAGRSPVESERRGQASQRRDAGVSRPYDEVRLVPFARCSRHGGETQLFGIVFALAATLIGLAVVNVAGLVAAHTQDRARTVRPSRAGRQPPRRDRPRGAGAVWLLVCAGTAIGAVLARPLLALTVRVLPDGLTLLKPAEIDARVLVSLSIAAAASTIAVLVLTSY